MPVKRIFASDGNNKSSLNVSIFINELKYNRVYTCITHMYENVLLF